MKTAAAVLLGVLLQPIELPVRVLDCGQQSGIDQGRQVVAASAEAFAPLWREHSATAVPPVDFGRESVVGLFAGTRSTAGYALEVVAVVKDGAATTVRYREHRPAPDAMVAQMLTSPYCIVAVPRVDGPVRFESVP